MVKRKILISPDILSEYAPIEKLEDISLKFVLLDEYHNLNINLTPLLDGTLERRKEIQQFKNFLINTPKSLATKKLYYKAFNQMVLALKHDFKNDPLIRLEKYHFVLISKIKNNLITDSTYNSHKSLLKIIFTECYHVNHKDFIKIFGDTEHPIKNIDNATILNREGQEKGFSKHQFREIGKIFLQLSDFFEQLLSEPNLNKNKINFKYQNIYNLDINLIFKNYHYLKNRKTFCLIIVFISLTGINLAPLIRMKRSDIIIDKERNLISFNATCQRKRRTQSHSYPMRENQLKFFERIISNSLLISPEEDILFPFIRKNSQITYFNHYIAKCYDLFNIGFCGEYKDINITAQKLRHSFGSQFESIDLRAVALFNNINTAARHYSTGNSEENNQQLQTAMNIYTIALSTTEDIQTVRDNIEKINTIKIHDIASLKQENSQISSNGIFCINSKEGNEPEKFSRRMGQLTIDTPDTIHCANILACFNCKNSIIVNNFENVYLLKSFYSYLNSIIYNSDTSSLFSDKNSVKNAIIGIDIVLDTKIDKKIIKKVEDYMDKHGIHPLWDLNGELI